MIPHTRSAVAAVSLSAALTIAVAACTSAGELRSGEAAAATAKKPYEATPRLGTASAALQTGVSTGAMTRAPQRPAPMPPLPATGPSIAALHAPAPGAPPPIIPEPAAASGPAPSPAAATRAPAVAPAARTAGLGAADAGEGRRLFNAFSCGACHVLADAEGTGHVGPALDGNPTLTRDFVIGLVTNGRGAMPGFGGAMSDEEIAVLASYVVGARK